MHSSPPLFRLAALIFFVSFFAAASGFFDMNQAQAQSRSRKNAARDLIQEMSESEDEKSGFDSDFDADFDADLDPGDFDADSFDSENSGADDSSLDEDGWENEDADTDTDADGDAEADGDEDAQGAESDKKSRKKMSAKKSKSGKNSSKASKSKKSSWEKEGKSGSSKKSKGKDKSKGKKSRSKNKKSGKKGKDVEPEDLRTPEEKERDRMEYYRQTGIWQWPELSPEQLEVEIGRQKEYMERVKAVFPQMVYYESEHFFYLTDAPQAIALECLKYLEAMYAKLCEMFEFSKDKPVWSGKCIVCAFVFQQHFLQFEQQFFHETAQKFSGASGLAHMSSDGNVLISLFYGDISGMDKRWQFIGTLVHETTHGFVHRYRARQNIPLWLNEGMAEYVRSIIVPADKQVALKKRSGLEKMRMFGSVNGLMTSDGPLEAWQYGVATGLLEFLISQKPHSFKLFLDDIKDGKEWIPALQEHYGCTPEELLFHFGRSNRIPRLTF